MQITWCTVVHSVSENYMKSKILLIIDTLEHAQINYQYAKLTFF